MQTSHIFKSVGKRLQLVPLTNKACVFLCSISDLHVIVFALAPLLYVEFFKCQCQRMRMRDSDTPFTVEIHGVILGKIGRLDHSAVICKRTATF